MEELLSEIIIKFNLKKNNVEIFDCYYQKNEELQKLEKAYDYYISKTEKKQQVLFMEFAQKIQKVMTRNLNNKKRENYYKDNQFRSYRKTYPKLETFVFILLDPETQNMLVFKLDNQPDLYSFICIESVDHKMALDIIKNNVKMMFNFDLNILKMFSHQKENLNFGASIYFCYVSEAALKKQRKTSFVKNPIFLNVTDSSISKNYEFMVINNYIGLVKRHLTEKEDLIEEVLGDTRKKSISLPVKLENDFFLEFEEDKELEDFTDNPFSRQSFQRRTSIDIQTKIKELNLNLDSILKSHNLI
jgi:hypothetical protein